MRDGQLKVVLLGPDLVEVAYTVIERSPLMFRVYHDALGKTWVKNTIPVMASTAAMTCRAIGFQIIWPKRFGAIAQTTEKLLFDEGLPCQFGRRVLIPAGKIKLTIDVQHIQ